MAINQDRLISLAGGFQYSKMLLCASELGIFSFIGDGAKSVDEIVTGLNLDREATGMFMGALVALGLVTHRAGRFKNAPDVKKYLGKESDEGLSCITRHMNHMYETWAGLDDIVRKGRPRKRPPSKIMTESKYNRDFICGMMEIGIGTARLLADAVDLKGVKKMVDIGGGPAQYPIAFARKNPRTMFVVADYPNTIKVAKDYVRKYSLEDRIKLAKCEFFDVKELGIGDDFDLALISQVLHAASDDSCRKLLKKTFRILKAGGRIIVNENALNDDGMSPPPPLIFAINMLVNTDGRTFTVGEIAAWLKEAGFKDVKSKRLHERSVIVEGTK